MHYISHAFLHHAPPPIHCGKSPFLCASARTCVLQDCSHERFDSGSHYRQEQFSQHKIEKRAALRNKPPPEPNWPLISSENALAAKDFDFEGRGRDLLLFLCLQLSARQT